MWVGSLLSTFTLPSVPLTTIQSLAVALTSKLLQESSYSFCPKSVSQIIYSTLHCQKHFPEHFHLVTSQSRVPTAPTVAKPFSSPTAFTGFRPCTGHFSGHLPPPVQHEDQLPALTGLSFLKDKTDTRHISRSFQVIVLLLVTQPCPALCYPMDCSLSVEFSRQEYWSG